MQDAAGATVALISYNGRVWTTERDWQQRREITGSALHADGGAR